MIGFLQSNLCTGCSSCMNGCKNDAITMEYDSDGFIYPHINEQKCVKCGLCKRICPVLKSENMISATPATYAVKSREEEVLVRCSSGGVFAHMAREIIKKQGIVFGAAFNKNLDVEHISVSKNEDLHLIYSSKYLQSNIGQSYRLCKKYLDLGKNVLFSGTPCQIAGLYSYLGTDYSNLITVEVVCHGVPSRMVFKKHISELKHKNNSNVAAVNFRCKDTGWNNFSVKYLFENGKQLLITHKEDFYMQVFLKNLSLRPSCYNCNFKKGKSGADLTIGDFWGIENVIPDFETRKGVSLVMCNTSRGNDFFNKIAPDLEYQLVEYERAICGNSAYFKSVILPEARDVFFRDVKHKKLSRCAKIYCSKNKRIFNIIQFKEDVNSVQTEKGKAFAVLWAIKHISEYKY